MAAYLTVKYFGEEKGYKDILTNKSAKYKENIFSQSRNMIFSPMDCHEY